MAINETITIRSRWAALGVAVSLGTVVYMGASVIDGWWWLAMPALLVTANLGGRALLYTMAPKAKTPVVRLTIPEVGSGPGAKVTIDGVDMTNKVSKVRLDWSVAQTPEILLTIPTFLADIEGAPRVSYEHD